jgi:hypothetical protein
MAIPAIMGLSRSLVHSSVVKLVLFAIAWLLQENTSTPDQ